MARRILAVCALLLTISSCDRDSDPQMAGEIDLARAAEYLGEFEKLCAEDGGRLWGVSFCGPILLVDPVTRMAVGNQADAGGVLEPRRGVFVGELPAEVGIANTATEWSGTRWTMLMWWSLGQDRTGRSRLMAHEAFHRLQPELGLAPIGEMNVHLETADGRFWLQMEWNALQRALSVEGNDRRAAVADALTFRASRRGLFPQATARETALEIFEGLAEYSGMRLAGFSDEGVVEAVAAKREQETGLVRSFAYVSGPLYGFLLDGSGDDWRARVSPDTDLGALLAESLDLSAASTDEALRRAESYGGPELLAAESESERERMERLSAWRASLIDGPVLIVDLTVVSSGTFDPGRVFPFGEGQTVYTTRELVGEWGKLSVTDGAILEDDDTGRAHVSLVGAGSDLLEGEGWNLELNDGWKIVAAERFGDFVVVER
jgi:hypothetical protein